MAITDVPEYAHLSDADLEEFAAALEVIRCDIEASRGANDRAYIKRAIAFHRSLEVTARLVIGVGKGKFGWAVGTAALAAAKCIENMELGHNISHGQWDWMNDPGNPFQHLGMGYGRSDVAMAVIPTTTGTTSSRTSSA